MSTETSIDNLTESINRTNKLLSHHQAFIRGIWGGLGATIGATLIIAIIFWILGQLEYSPFFGDFFKNLNDALKHIMTLKAVAVTVPTSAPAP